MEQLPFDSQWKEHFKGFHAVYNLLESRIPSTGHLGTMQALAILSKHLAGHDKGLNLAIVADPGDGKSLVLRQFQTLPNVNYTMYVTKANFLKTYAGRYCVQLGTGYTPDYVHEIDEMPETSSAPDLLNMHTLIISEGEMVATLHDSSFRMLLSLLNSLIEEGYWHGGDNYNGTYAIGGPKARIAFALSLACTPEIFSRYMLSDAFVSRLMPIWYRSLECERQDVMRRIEGKLLHSEPNVQTELENLLYSRLKPEDKVEVKVPQDVMEHLSVLSNLLRQIRLNGTGIWSTGKRDAKNALQLGEAMALLNGREQASPSDVFLSSYLANSLAVRRETITDDGGKTRTLETYTASKVHFLAHVCQMTRTDTRKFLSGFPDVHGQQLYSDEVITDALKDLGLKG